MDKKVEGGEPSAGPDFSGAVGSSDTYFLKIKANIEILRAALDEYDTKKSVNTPEAEADIKDKFSQFLIGCEFYMAKMDFDELLEESAAKPRDDGSIGWYHQMAPVLIFLSMIKDKTISLESLEQYGGLETALRTALRHDSIEDFGKDFDQFEKEQKQNILKKFTELQALGLPGFDDGRLQKEYDNLDILMQNLRLMTKKVAILDADGNPQYRPDGRMIRKDLFPNTRAYIHNMVNSVYASPVVWIIKVCDGIHNLSSMIGAPKFTAPRRLQYANQREDMYGSRQGLPEIAMQKWPEFAEGIKRVDHLMGSVLYTNFGYLEYVDQEKAYPDNSDKHKEGDEVHTLGIGKYLSGTLKVDVPRGLNPFYNLLDTIQAQTSGEEDINIRVKTIKFWEHSIKPALRPYALYFPRYFANGQSGGAPHSDKIVRAPNFI